MGKSLKMQAVINKNIDPILFRGLDMEDLEREAAKEGITDAFVMRYLLVCTRLSCDMTRYEQELKQENPWEALKRIANKLRGKRADE